MEKTDKVNKSFLSDVTLDFLDELDDMDIHNDEQFRYVQVQKRLDNMFEQNRKLSSLVKAVQFN